MTTYTIKPLAWEKYGAVHRAETCLFRYLVVTIKDGEFSARVVGGIESGGIGYYESLEAAKQACTEHWEGMIKQAMEEA